MNKQIFANIMQSPGVTKIMDQARARANELSPRDRLLIMVTGGLLALCLLYMIYEPIHDAFSRQSVALAEIESTIKRLSPPLDNYAKLKARRDAIEARYREVEIKEGALSHIENIIKTKAGVAQGQFTIREGTPREFGGNFEQTPFSIKFSTNNLATLISFLNEIVHGRRPLILSKVDLQMTRRSDSLDVDLEVNAMRRASGQQDR